MPRRHIAPKDNKYHEKYETPEKRLAVFATFCQHIENGFSKQSFPLCDPRTIDKMITDYPEEFTEEILESLAMAERLNLLYWERAGMNGMNGQIKDFNVIAWKFNIQNRHGWKDRQDMTSDDKEIKGLVIYKPEKNKD